MIFIIFDLSIYIKFIKLYTIITKSFSYNCKNKKKANSELKLKKYIE